MFFPIALRMLFHNSLEQGLRKGFCNTQTSPILSFPELFPFPLLNPSLFLLFISQNTSLTHLQQPNHPPLPHLLQDK